MVAVISAVQLGATSDTGSKQNLVVAFDEAPVQWNPLFTYSSVEAQLYTALYEGLVVYNPETLKPMPGIAESWSLSDDQKTITFKLRPKLLFSDGTALVSETLRQTWLALLNPQASSPFAGLLDPIVAASDYRTGKIKDAALIGIKCPDDTTFVVTLRAPTAYFVQVLCHQSLVPIHPKMLKETKWSPSKIVGNGPFVISSSSDEKVVLTPSENYWDRSSVKVSGLEWIFSAGDEAKTKAFNFGEIHWIESGVETKKIENPNTLKLTPQFSTTMLYFSNQDPIFNKQKVRAGLTKLLPLENMRSKDLFLVPSSRMIPQIPYYPRAGAIENQNKTEGLQLLLDAGFPRGKGLPPIRVVFPESELFSEIGEMIRSAWKDTDIKFELSFLSSDEYYRVLKPDMFTLASMSWIGDYADPMTFLDLWKSDSSLNSSLFSDPEYDQLLISSDLQQGTERYKTLSKAESRVLETAQVIPLGHSPALNIIDLEIVAGWFENPLNIHPFKNMYFKARKPPRNIASL